MRSIVLSGLVLAGSLALLAVPASAQDSVTAEEAHAIAVAAYLYFYPLITMDVTRLQSVNA